jgi:hypothetical protein
MDRGVAEFDVFHYAEFAGDGASRGSMSVPNT